MLNFLSLLCWSDYFCVISWDLLLIFCRFRKKVSNPEFWVFLRYHDVITTWSLPYKFHYHCFNILLWSYLGLGKSISFHVHRSGVKNSEKSPALIVWSVSAFPKLTESNAIRLDYWRNYSSWKVLKTQPGFLYIQQYFYNGMQTNAFLFFF